MNTFTLLNLMLMPSIFSVLQTWLAKESKGKLLQSTRIEEFIDIWKKWSNEEIDNSDELYCKHCLYLIVTFFHDFGYFDEIEEVFNYNSDILFENLDSISSSSKVSEALVESYFNGDQPEEEEISLDTEEVIEIVDENTHKNPRNDQNYEKIEESSTEGKKNFTTKYYVHFVKEIEYDPFDHVFIGTHELSLSVKNAIKTLFALQPTPAETRRKTILGVQREKVEIQMDKIIEEMNILKDIQLKMTK